MNRMGAEIAIEIDPRYNTMLKKIATMLNSNGVSPGNNPPTRLLLFIVVICGIKFIFY